MRWIWLDNELSIHLPFEVLEIHFLCIPDTLSDFYSNQDTYRTLVSKERDKCLLNNFASFMDEFPVAQASGSEIEFVFLKNSSPNIKS